MNPIALTAPDGRTYAYACGFCHHVNAKAELLVRVRTEGPIEYLVEASLQGAERCCTCVHCRAQLGGDEDFGGLCQECEHLNNQRRMWASVALCMEMGFTTQAQHDKYLYDDDLDDVKPF